MHTLNGKVIDIRIYKSDKRIEAAKLSMLENAAGASGAFLAELDKTGAPPDVIFLGALKGLTLYAQRHLPEMAGNAVLERFLNHVIQAGEDPQ